MSDTYDTIKIREDIQDLRAEVDTSTAPMLRIQEIVEGLHEDHRAITAKLDMIAATLANVQEQIQAMTNRVYARS